MFNLNIDTFIDNIYVNLMWSIEIYWPKILWALLILIFWIISSILIHKFIMYLFKKFKIIELIDRLNIDFDDKKGKENKEKGKENKEKGKENKISDKIKINVITAKAISYYTFLVFFRFAIVIIWIKEVENFMWELLAYLPSLFIAVVIWFFWIRFANFIHDIIYHALNLSKQKTSKIIAWWAKVIILFFTLMVVLSKVWIANNITDTILIWFVSMLSIAWWLAFWLWGRDIAKEILESFRK